MVVSVGVDVSKDKHDCFILSSEGEVLADVFTIPNNLDGFRFLLRRIRDCTHAQDKIKVVLEATGHYSYNLLGFLLDNGLPTYVLNPLRTNLYRKSLSLRKTKTDRVDARTIAASKKPPAVRIVMLHPQCALLLYPCSTSTVWRYLTDQQKCKGLWLEPFLSHLVVGDDHQSTASLTV